jgi:UDP-N-acetylmuramate--alanine ligase
VWRLGRDFEVDTVRVDPDGRVLRFRDPVEDRPVTGRISILGGNVADNAALAFAALRALGFPPDEAGESLAALDGLDRRLEYVGAARGVRVFDDLGKHPEAMAANLRALRDVGPRHIHVVFEPSLHADVLRWGRRWVEVLGQADTAVVLPVNYRASLPVARRAPADWPRRLGSAAELVEQRDDAIDHVQRRCRPSDFVLICGMADDLARVARRLLDRLAA